MSDIGTVEFGVIITNKVARRWIYIIYVILLLVAGGLHVWFFSGGQVDPQWLTQATAVLTYLGIPVGALGAANAANPTITATGAGTTSSPAVITAMPEPANPTAGLTPAPVQPVQSNEVKS